MEHTRKFVFVDPDLLTKLTEKNKIFNEHSTRLHNEVASSLASKSNTKELPIDQQAIIYAQNLDKYLKHKNNVSLPITVSGVDQSSDILRNELTQLKYDLTQKYDKLIDNLNKQNSDFLSFEPSTSLVTPSTSVPVTSPEYSSTPKPKKTTKHRKGMTKSVRDVIQGLSEEEKQKYFPNRSGQRLLRDQKGSGFRKKISNSRSAKPLVGAGFRKWNTFYPKKRYN